MRGAIPPDLRNRDGDPLLLTVDHFEVAAGAMAAVEACVAELDGAHREPAGEGTSAYVFLRPVDPAEPDGEQTLLGRLRIGAEALRIETNSEARADALRLRVEEVCGSRLRHRAREHMDPLALANQSRRAPQPPPPPSPQQEHMVAEFEAPLRRLGGPAAGRAEREDATRLRANRGRTRGGRPVAQGHGAHGAPRPGSSLRFHRDPAQARHRAPVAAGGSGSASTTPSSSSRGGTTRGAGILR